MRHALVLTLLLIAGMSPCAVAQAPAASDVSPSPSRYPALRPPVGIGGIANVWGGAFLGPDGESRYAASFTAYGWDANVTGTIVISNSPTSTARCFSVLHISGYLDWDNMFRLVAKSDDGIARMTLVLAVSGDVLGGTYDVLQTGTACDGDSGRTIAYSNLQRGW